MSDLLAVILLVVQDEVDAFWCFASLMEMYGANFDFDQVGMRTNLEQLAVLMRFLEPGTAVVRCVRLRARKFCVQAWSSCRRC